MAEHSDRNEADMQNKPASQRLEDLVSQATIQYSLKNYDDAAELYAHATELQAELNGEMSTQNADLLYYYGRCLYHLAVRKSDVLGSKVASDKPQAKRSAPKPDYSQRKTATLPPSNPPSKTHSSEAEKSAEASEQTGKPFFLFTGDENFDSSEDDGTSDEEVGVEEEGVEEEDDFANAFEVLDIARILLLQKLEESRGADEEASSEAPSLSDRPIQERLADTFDLQAEISLEAERFEDAAMDFRSSLEWKIKLYPPESSLLAESHYKLSLALEFASCVYPRDETGQIVDGKEPTIIFEKREEAAQEMEAAIDSCKLRITMEEAKSHASTRSDESAEVPSNSSDLKDVKGMVEEMQLRLTELRRPPMTIKSEEEALSADAQPLLGILGSMVGQSEESKKAKIEEAMKGAHDLTRLVKKQKNRGRSPASTSNHDITGKRKADDAEQEDLNNEKKVKLEE